LNKFFKNASILFNSKLIPLRNMYIPALALLVLFTVYAHYNEQQLVHSLKNDGTIINLTGKQRMLSQKLEVLALIYSNTPTQNNRHRLEEEIYNIHSSHIYLKKHFSNNLQDFKFNTKNAESIYKDYISEIENLLQNNREQTLANIQIKSKILLEELTLLVSKYEEYNKTKIDDLEEKQHYLLFFFILFVLLEVIFIFHPTSKKILENTEELKDTIEDKRLELQKSLNILSKFVIFSKTNHNGIIIEVSDAFCDISGYTREELVGQSHNLVRHPDMPSSTFQDLWDDIINGRINNQKIKNLRKDGTFYWVDAYIAPEYNKHGTLISYISIRKDVTAQKELEELNSNLEQRIYYEVEKNTLKDREMIELVSEQKEHLSTVIESNNNAIIAIDKTRTILTYNQKAEDIFGFTQEEMLGTQNLLNIIPLKYQNLHTVASAKFFSTGKSAGIINSTLELEGLTKDERIIPIRISFGANKHLVVANITDISKEKQQEKKLIEQSRLAQMGEMLSLIAHQWRQPLASIGNASYSVQAKLRTGKFNLEVVEDRERLIKFIEKKHTNINEYVQFLSTTIDDFRNFFKPNKATAAVKLSEPIEKALQIIENSIKDQHINLIKKITVDDVIEMHKSEMIQVILNILKNAEDNFKEKNIVDAQIIIQTMRDEENLIISISDNGGGIPENIIENIFDPYFSTKSEKNGTGLGLYMSKIIVEKNDGGKLLVQNIENGVEFKIILEKDSKNE